MSDPRLPDSNPRKRQDTCDLCERGREACEWCHNLDDLDYQAICDCGLHDFGRHLLDCRERDKYRYVVACDYATAELPR
jgi:hypothetical protein